MECSNAGNDEIEFLDDPVTGSHLPDLKDVEIPLIILIISNVPSFFGVGDS